MRLIFKTSSVTPDFFYVFNLILSFSTCSESFEKICAWELLDANVLKYNEFLSRNSPLSEICSLLNKFIYSANMIYKKNRWKRGHIQEKKRLKDVSLRVSYVPFITVFSDRSFFIWQRKQLLLLNFYNSSSIKAFRVSSAASSNFRLIDMVSPYIRHLSRHEDITRARFQINFDTIYPASVVGVGMNYKTLAYWIWMKSYVLKN